MKTYGTLAAEEGLMRILPRTNDSAEVALLFTEVNGQNAEQAFATIHEIVNVTYDATLSYFGKPCRFFVVKVLKGKHISGTELRQLKHLLERNQWSNVRMWPLHQKEYGIPLMQLDDQNTIGQYFGWWNENQLSLLKSLRVTYGSKIAYCVAWVHLFTRSLWALVVMSTVVLFTKSDAAADNMLSKTTWLLLLIVLMCWSLTILWRTSDLKKHPLLDAATSDADECDFEDDDDDDEDDEATVIRHVSHAVKHAQILYFPAFVYTIVVTLLLLSVIQLKLWLAYSWGDCLRIRLQRECMYAVTKHGLGGWLANLGSNILLALIFLVLGPVARGLGVKIAQDYELSELRTKQVALNVGVTLEVLGKVGTFVFLGLVFVPKWVESEGTRRTNCNHMFGHAVFGESWFLCLHRQITVHERRQIFEDTMIGPLVVAPILIVTFRVFLPYVTYKLDKLSRRTVCCVEFCDSICDAVIRFFSYLFVYDKSFVGGLAFISQGWPFAAANGSDEHIDPIARHALQQGAKKPFDPIHDVFFLKLSWLWMLFFLPVLPWGIFPTVVIWILEANNKLDEIMLVHRRSFPERARLIHPTLINFLNIVFVLAILWWAALLLLTYNDSSYRFFP